MIALTLPRASAAFTLTDPVECAPVFPPEIKPGASKLSTAALLPANQVEPVEIIVVKVEVEHDIELCWLQTVQYAW